MATSIKISQLPAKGSNLEATDLLEVSEFNGTGYVSKSITGQEIIDSVPSSVTAWGTITGTLSSQTDLNTALSGKQATVTLTTTGTSGASTFVANTLNVPTYSLSGLGGVPTTRTLTINGTTQDLSADRTFTISTGITIGTTAITSGTVGRVLFEGTGNVVQESANFTYTVASGLNLIGGASTSATNAILIQNSALTEIFKIRNDAFVVGKTTEFNLQANGLTVPTNGSQLMFNLVGNGQGMSITNQNGTTFRIGQYAVSNVLTIGASGISAFNIFASTGNIGINTTTDAGFKLDVNGTARFVGNVSLGSPNINDKLEVYGNILVRANDRIRLAGTSDGNTALYATSGAAAQMNVKNGSGSTFDITFGTIGSTTRMLRVNSFDSTTPSVVVGNNATAFASSVLTVESTTQGFLPPRMTTTQKNAIASPATGLMVYDTTLNLMALYNGTTWTTL
jgi:hypothetical protein